MFKLPSFPQSILGSWCTISANSVDALHMLHAGPEPVQVTLLPSHPAPHPQTSSTHTAPPLPQASPPLAPVHMAPPAPQSTLPAHNFKGPNGSSVAGAATNGDPAQSDGGGAAAAAAAAAAAPPAPSESTVLFESSPVQGSEVSRRCGCMCVCIRACACTCTSSEV
eukprot:1157588-Pelagomonas_calceolata.AAC.15